ncbi:MAG: 23S rRNA (guanosine(2251)-2'-O)-methyltransferase RlmB [Patescibacteria group bacterium]
MQREKVYIYGKHAIAEAVQNASHVVKKVFIAPTFDDAKVLALIRDKKIPTATLKGSDVVGNDAVHQGLVAIIETEALLIPFDTFAKTLDVSKKPALVLLGELQDPHNVGAIIRSAAAMGLSGVLIPEHRNAPITGAVVKTSAGMAFRIPLISIGNVNQTIRILKDKGFWTYGLAGKGSQELPNESFTEPSLFIIGNEGKGIREKTEELCDVLLRIPMHPRTESLNAAASAAIVFYEWSRGHKDALK